MEGCIPFVKLLKMVPMLYNHNWLLFVVMLLLSGCSMANEGVVLTPFSQAVIQSYSNHYCQVYMKDPEILFISVHDDKEYSYLIVWGEQDADREEFPFTFKHYLGRTLVNKRPVFVSGPRRSFFYKARRHHSFPFKGILCEYDPYEWRIAIRKNDTTYCQMKSNNNSLDFDDEIVDSVALMFYEPSIMTGDEVYTNSDLSPFGVAHPSLSYEERQQLIITKYRFDDPMPLNKSIIINLFVDKNGYASIHDVEKKSGIKRFDKEALRMSKEICDYHFNPAQIRNHNVNSIYSLYFCDKGLFSL